MSKFYNDTEHAEGQYGSVVMLSVAAPIFGANKLFGPNSSKTTTTTTTSIATTTITTTTTITITSTTTTTITTTIARETTTSCVKRNHSLKLLNIDKVLNLIMKYTDLCNGRESVSNRALDGSTYPG
jgi:hypothetical protein